MRSKTGRLYPRNIAGQALGVFRWKRIIWSGGGTDYGIRISGFLCLRLAAQPKWRLFRRRHHKLPWRMLAQIWCRCGRRDIRLGTGRRRRWRRSMGRHRWFLQRATRIFQPLVCGLLPNRCAKHRLHPARLFFCTRHQQLHQSCTMQKELCDDIAQKFGWASFWQD